MSREGALTQGCRNPLGLIQGDPSPPVTIRFSRETKPVGAVDAITDRDIYLHIYLYTYILKLINNLK